jgi:hypothetical protein
MSTPAPKKKYSFGKDGTLQAKSSAPTSTPLIPQHQTTQAVTIVCSMEEAVQASTDCGGQFQLAPATQQAIEIFQSDEFTKQFGQAPGGPMIEGCDVLDGLTTIFAQYQIPIGLLDHLRKLSAYRLNFIIDDSGSMKSATDLLFSHAVPYVKQRQNRFIGLNQDPRYMTRYEEAEQRLHIMFDILAYIPTRVITLSCLNVTTPQMLSHEGQTPEKFAAQAHALISQMFSLEPKYQTPTYRALYNAFYNHTGELTSHYLLTDGLPQVSGDPMENVAKVAQLIKTRPNPYYNALTLISCTTVDSECEWMKQIEEDGPYTSELDDFNSESKEILNDQGPSFPFSYGFWLICHLVASINPDDLDAMDEEVPFTRFVFSRLIGRELSTQEYANYWSTNRHAQKYNQYYNEFMTDNQRMARQIVGLKN